MSGMRRREFFALLGGVAMIFSGAAAGKSATNRVTPKAANIKAE
jgi:hypothetical protein